MKEFYIGDKVKVINFRHPWMKAGKENKPFVGNVGHVIRVNEGGDSCWIMFSPDPVPIIHEGRIKVFSEYWFYFDDLELVGRNC
jgi:hypothetical protein